MTSPPNITTRLIGFTDGVVPGRWRNPAPSPNYSVTRRAPDRAAAAGTALCARRELPPTEQMDICSRFGRQLRQLREEHDMTQSGMAKKFGIDRSYISDVERGRKSISLPLLEVIALGFGISLSDLLRTL